MNIEVTKFVDGANLLRLLRTREYFEEFQRDPATPGEQTM